MTKLCPRGKAAAKRKFKVYTSAYANAYASKIFDDASKKRKEFKKGSGKKFPDLTGDGKVTFADILKGRGVINGKKKKK